MGAQERKWSENDLERIEHLKSTGKTWREIGNEFGAEREAVRSAWRKRHPNTGGNQEEVPQEGKSTVSVDLANNSMYIVTTSPRIMNEQELIEHFKVDVEQWDLVAYEVSTHEGYRKDRKVNWKVEDGRVLKGEVDDTGRLVVVPLYSVKARFKKRVVQVHVKNLLEEFRQDAKAYAPVYLPTKTRKYEGDGQLLEVDMFDVHFGRLTWAEETGQNYDISIAKRNVLSVLEQLLDEVMFMPIERILLPLGNDFFNVDGAMNATTRGTPQQEDTRWQKTFRRGRELLVTVIDNLREVAPVDILMIPGNHEEERSFYLGDSLYAWYHNAPDVMVNNAATTRKYYQYAKNLIGFTHGSNEKPAQLPYLMAHEVPQMFANTTFREWHIGHIHHKNDFMLKTNEAPAMLVRTLRALTPIDAWTYNKAFVGAEQTAEAFVWTQTGGVKNQITIRPKRD